MEVIPPSMNCWHCSGAVRRARHDEMLFIVIHQV
jgi:tryptophan 2,3-dioxygenase